MIRAAFVALLLSGCAATDQQILRVEVPVAVPCIPADKIPARPEYLSRRGDYPGDAQAAALIAADLERAIQYGTLWEAAAAGCVEHK